MATNDKKGITVKVEEELHAEVKQYIEDHEMTMAEFVTLALQDEHHPNRTNMFGILCACSLGLSAIGICIAIAIGNAFLAPVMAVGLMFVPFWYVKTTATNYKKAISSELETALSIITTAYLRNKDIITSIEENVHYLNAPVKAVFENFISRIKLSNPDITAAILNMKSKIDNEVFAEWCDILIFCQSDRRLKSTLTPIVNKLSDICAWSIKDFLENENKSIYDAW